MHSITRKFSILTLITVAALYIPVAEAKGGAGGGGGAHAGSAAGAAGATGGGSSAGRAGGTGRGAGRGVGGVGGYGAGGYNYGTSATQDPQAPKKAGEASDTSNYGRGSTK